MLIRRRLQIYRCLVVFSYQWRVVAIPILLHVVATGIYATLFVLSCVDEKFVKSLFTGGETYDALSNSGLAITLATNSITTSRPKEYSIRYKIVDNFCN